MTRDRETIRREIAASQSDLEADVNLLDDLVRSKLDVKQRARDAARRGAAEARDLASRVRVGARARPGTAILVVTVFALLIALQLRARRAGRDRHAMRTRDGVGGKRRGLDGERRRRR